MSATILTFPQERVRDIQYGDELRQLAELVAARTRRKGVPCTAESLLPKLQKMWRR